MLYFITQFFILGLYKTLGVNGFAPWFFSFFMRFFLKNKLWQNTAEPKLSKKDSKKNASIS